MHSSIKVKDDLIIYSNYLKVECFIDVFSTNANKHCEVFVLVSCTDRESDNYL